MNARVARAVVSTSKDFPDDHVIEVFALATLPSLSCLPRRIFIKGSAS